MMAVIIGWRPGLRKTVALYAAVLGLWAFGCNTRPALNTASGRPEVVIQGKTAPQILKAAEVFFVQRDYALRPSDNAYKLTFDRRTEKPGAEPSASTCWRVRLALADLKNGSYRLTGTPLKVDDCGRDLEAEHVMPGAFAQIQELLQKIKSQLEIPQ